MTILMRTDPFRQLEQWSQQLVGQPGLGGRPTLMRAMVPSRSLGDSLSGLVGALSAGWAAGA